MAPRREKNKKVTARPGHRISFGLLPEPAAVITNPYAKARDQLAGLDEAELVMMVVNHPLFDEIIGSICDKLDATASSRGPMRAYSARDCEMVLLYQRMLGKKSYKEARVHLASDVGARARELFGFDQARDPKPERFRKTMDGVPSESTVSRHRTRFGEKRRNVAFQRLFRGLVRAHLQEFPEMREEARMLQIDGSKIETHYTCPKFDRGKLVNGDSVTCHDGGYIGKSAPKEKQGDGYNLHPITTMSALPLCFAVTALNAPESKVAARLIRKSFTRDVLSYLQQGKEVGELTADGAYADDELRQEIAAAGYIENIHAVSHRSQTAEANAAKHDKMLLKIDGYPNWVANGHYEIRCKCGEGHTWVRFRRSDGLAVRTEGSCGHCGPISITRGRWRKVPEPGRVRPRAARRGGQDRLGVRQPPHLPRRALQDLRQQALQQGRGTLRVNDDPLQPHEGQALVPAHPAARDKTAPPCSRSFTQSRWNSAGARPPRARVRWRRWRPG